MTQDATAPASLDRAGRLNAALLAKGRIALTTAATGDVDLPLLLRTLEAIGMAVDASAPDGAGIITVTITRPGRAQGERPTRVFARSPSRSAATVEAAIAALSELPHARGPRP